MVVRAHGPAPRLTTIVAKSPSRYAVSVNQDPAVGRLDPVTIDCGDPERQAAFWSAVFGTRVQWRGGDPVVMRDPEGNEFCLVAGDS